jgi:hypothetical protein
MPWTYTGENYPTKGDLPYRDGLSRRQYLILAFLTILATATGWEIIALIRESFPPIFFPNLSYVHQTIIMFIILLAIFFGFLALGWFFVKRSGIKLSERAKLPL